MEIPSRDNYENALTTDHKDSVLYMKLRRIINGQYAEHPVDFNIAGILAGQRLLQRTLTSHDVIADIGGSSGEMAANAALTTGTWARIVCVDPAEDAGALHRLLSSEQRQRVPFLRGMGEAIPLRDNSVVGATLHNVIFRVQDAKALLQEVKRVVIPGGFVAISSNARGHAYYRHQFERNVAQMVAKISGINLTIPTPPAEGQYLEDLPRTIQEVGGLKIIDDLYVDQDTQAIITRGKRLDDYVDSIKFSAANVNLPGEYRYTWRTWVDLLVRPYIETEIRGVEQAYREAGIEAQPYFADPIIRGMFVLRNEKAA